MNIETIISLTLSGLSVLGVIVIGYLQLTIRPPRPKTQEALDIADASSKVTQSAIDLSENYARQIAELRMLVENLQARVSMLAGMELENASLKKEVAALQDENKTLREEMEALQIRIAFLEGERSKGTPDVLAD